MEEAENCRYCRYFYNYNFLESGITKEVGEKWFCNLSGNPQFIDNLSICAKYQHFKNT